MVYAEVKNHVKVVTTKEISENDNNLNIPLYADKIIKDTLPTVEVATADLKSAWEENLPV